MNWFDRQVTTRVLDYGWAYRLRLDILAGDRDARELAEGTERPVLLLPGVYETWHFLHAVGSHLHSLGHPIHIVPEFGRNLRPIPEMAELAADYLTRTGLEEFAIAAHSKGGLIGKTLMVDPRIADRVTAMVAINSPFGGSDYARLVPIRTLREFVPTHDTIRALAANAQVNRRITSVYSEWDPIVPNGSELDGATNIRLPVSGHFRILDRPDLLDIVARSIRAA
jgi:pimeloyl-ACP methyl ester carboxylesterase